MDALRILITGSRDWTDVAMIREAIRSAGRAFGVHPAMTTIVEGGARGADRLARQVGKEFGCRVETVEANWRELGRAAGHRRNAEMVTRGADICLAFPLPDSRGTRDCMEQARDANIPVIDFSLVKVV